MLASSPVLSHQEIRSCLVHRESCMALPSEARLPRYSHSARRAVFPSLLFSSVYVILLPSSDLLQLTVDEQAIFGVLAFMTVSHGSETVFK